MASLFTFIFIIPGQEPVLNSLEGAKITFGRGPDNGIQILASEVSVTHGEFVQGGPGYKIVDKGSTNGTKVNGVRIDSSGKPLVPMDKILFGETISAYFVPTAALQSTPIADLIQSIENSPKSAAQPQAAPIAVAAPVAASPAPGGAPVAPVRPTPVAPAGARPVPVQPAAPLQPAAAAPGAATVKLDQVRPPAGGGPAKPPAAPALAAAAPRPPVAAPAPPAGAPAAPGGAPAPQPVSPTPLTRPPAPGQAPNIPLPGANKEE